MRLKQVFKGVHDASSEGQRWVQITCRFKEGAQTKKVSTKAAASDQSKPTSGKGSVIHVTKNM